jgi:NAD(P)-dependent dehydrogenase (short-subunit alcohol dehydrogenase family)
VRELKVRGVPVFGAVCDVTDQAQVDEFLSDAGEMFGPVDVLVNNAGIINAGPVECMTHDDYRRGLETHFWGPIYAIEGVLPEMRARGAGHIVNIASIGGKISVPHLSAYAASKSALVGYSEGLRAELAQDGILVTTVCPGLIRTGSARNAEFKGRHREEFAWFNVGSSLPLLTINSTRAARRILEATRRGVAFAPVSISASLAMRAHGAAPNLASALLSCVNRWLPTPGGIGSQSRKGWQSQSDRVPTWVTRFGEQAAVANHEIGPQESRERDRNSQQSGLESDSRIWSADSIHEAGLESFPASDPPAHAPVTRVD